MARVQETTKTRARGSVSGALRRRNKWPILAPTAAMENLRVFGTTTQDFKCQINQETIIYAHNTFRKNFYNLCWVG